jgi:hypothetical protein
MAKIGRNALCSCGSQKKYKHCCLRRNPIQSGRWIPSLRNQAELTQFVRKLQRDAEQAKYAAPPYHEFELQGHEFRIIGKSIQPDSGLSNNIVKEFKSQVLGQQWMEDEQRKPVDERHIVIKWLSAWDELAEKSRKPDPDQKTVWLTLTGETQELIALADDCIRILQTHKRFPRKLRSRLLNWREFQGARYEIAVAAIFIRCNFEIEWIDEKTGPANSLGKRCEFNAIHPVTGETIAVEAKSRRRKGTLHEGGIKLDPATLRADVDALYKDAVDKNPWDKPFAIFIDVNLPHQPDRQGLDKTWTTDIRAMLEKYASANPDAPVPFSFLLVTNFAWHFEGGDTAGAAEHIFFYIPNAQFPVSQRTFDAIGQAVRAHGRIPGYLLTSSNRPMPVPDSAHHVTVDLTVMTNSQSQALSSRGERRTLGQGYRSCYDTPYVVPQPVEIPVKDGTTVKRLIAVWYEPLENSAGLEGFERFDVAPRTDEHSNAHFDLLASSQRGVAKETKIRVHVVYETA